MEWDRVRVFLAVARSSKILGAARILGLNHATVGRQLTALEKEVGAKLVERRPDGCALTPIGESLLTVAERVESEFLKFDAGLSHNGDTSQGTVRVGAPDGLGNYFLAATLAQFARIHPRIVVQLVPLPRNFSLSRREADIAIVLDRPTHGNLIVKKLTDYSVGLYGSCDYLDSAPPIRTEKDLTRHMLVTYVDDLVYTRALDYGRTLLARMPQRFECGSVVGQMEAVRAGHGISILHDYAARRYKDLRQVLPRIQFVRSYWMMSHPDTHDSIRVSLVRQHISDAVSRDRTNFLADGAKPDTHRQA